MIYFNDMYISKKLNQKNILTQSEIKVFLKGVNKTTILKVRSKSNSFTASCWLSLIKLK